MHNSLKFNNGKFTIMTLGDLHENLYIDSRDKRKRREDMHNLVKAGILTYKPDLIVLLGDILSAKDDSEGFKDYKSALRDILKPVIDSRIPFTYVLGNHEHDQGQEELIVEAYKEIETCIGENDPTCPRGNFNCNLLVKNTEGTEDILNLWLVDSNNLCDNQEISVYDWVHEDQIEWYEKTAQRIKDEHGGKTIPAILFQHNPVYEEYELLKEATPLEKIYGAVEGHHKFSDKKYVLKDGVEGYLGEGPCTPCFNGGQFASWKKTGDVIGAFFGHDHLNDFTGYIDGSIQLLGMELIQGIDPMHRFRNGGQRAVGEHISCVTGPSVNSHRQRGLTFALDGYLAVIAARFKHKYLVTDTCVSMLDGFGPGASHLFIRVKNRHNIQLFVDLFRQVFQNMEHGQAALLHIDDAHAVTVFLIPAEGALNGFSGRKNRIHVTDEHQIIVISFPVFHHGAVAGIGAQIVFFHDPAHSGKAVGEKIAYRCNSIAVALAAINVDQQLQLLKILF